MFKLLRKAIFTIIIIIIIYAIINIFDVPSLIYERLYPKHYSEYVEKYSKEYDMDPNLIYALIKVESNFNTHAESRSSAIGLMQLMETTAVEMSNQTDINDISQKDLYNPETNIQLGTKYLSYLYEIYHGNIYLALAAYNAGIGNVNTWIRTGVIRQDGTDIENIPFKETNNYVRKVMRDYKIYLSIY